MLNRYVYLPCNTLNSTHFIKYLSRVPAFHACYFSVHSYLFPLITYSLFSHLIVLFFYTQAKWYLNAFWSVGADQDAEEVWKICEGFIKTDHQFGKQGKELNEVLAHHYLQQTGKTMTALELRAELRKIDLDANGEMALLEYILFKFNRPLKECIHNPQGGEANAAEVAAATAQLESLNKAGDDLVKELAEQKEAEVKAKEASEASAKAADDALDSEKKAVSKVRIIIILSLLIAFVGIRETYMYMGLYDHHNHQSVIFIMISYYYYVSYTFSPLYRKLLLSLLKRLLLSKRLLVLLLLKLPVMLLIRLGPLNAR